MMLGILGIVFTVLMAILFAPEEGIKRFKRTIYKLSQQCGQFVERMFTRFTKRAKVSYSLINVPGLFCEEWGRMEILSSQKPIWWRRWLRLTSNNIHIKFTPDRPIAYLNSVIGILVFGRWHNFRQRSASVNMHGTVEIVGQATRRQQ